MSEPIKFFASIESLNAGDEEIRLVLFVKDTPVDLAAAVSMLGKLNRVLKVGAYLGSGDECLASFPACIPQMKTGLQFRKDKPPVIRLDIPASDSLSALRLVGYSESLVRFEVEDEGQRVEKSRKAQQRPKEEKPHGAMWRELFLAGFSGCPGVMEAREPFSGYGLELRMQLRKVFGVESLSREVGAGEIYKRFPPEEFPQVKVMVEQALRKAGQ